MSEHTELLALILPPQGRLVVAAADTAGLLPGPGLALALEHKGATGSQTVAGLLDRERVEQLVAVLHTWLQHTYRPPRQPVTEAALEAARPDTVDVIDSSTVARWLASGAEQLRLDDL